MEIIQVPQAVKGQPQIAAGDIVFLNYRDRGGPFRSRVLFECCAFSFVQHGQKRIYRAGGNTTLRYGHGVLIPEGNSIIAEHSNTDALYQSFIVFFPARLGHEFMAGKPAQPQPKANAPYLYFEVDSYIQSYVDHLRSLIDQRQTLSAEMAVLKIRELLTALYELAPDVITALFGAQNEPPLKHLVEANLMNPLTLEELAFLANRSLSSFKRDFEKAYGVSPQKYIRERRLEMAAAELDKGKPVSSVYLDYGYQHLSNFNTAFRRQYGSTPADWALRNKD
ncbi:helix-turn-helix transcriptional regulator [Mucilaginibacter sp. 14171R-50]|uniref:helix-turn-helix transcriptional regulator n=1 Tax=Mucilaginibacter sp. 14171R-50 TaxID=2703789 RepID=UPI00138D9631|nr:AraC family transcriptional regulator [Mucilaginibacter sp. 14171R-50]QHS56415.1 helix-turn-helix transcriptional regulator [Mucilaginibacter sp. 14171R-50]